MDFVLGILAFLICLDYFDYWDKDENSTNKKVMKKRFWSKTEQDSVTKSGLKVFVDEATGVQYVKASYFDKLQVRINKDGTPYTGE